MRYFIEHTTRFLYSHPVHENLTEIRMAPRTEGNQRCFQFRLTTRPNVQVLRYDDHFGNVVYHFDVPTPHAKLEIHASAAVEVEAAPELPESLTGGEWDRLDALRDDGEFWDWLQPSHFATRTKALDQLARSLKLDDRRHDPLTTLRAVNRGIYRRFAYNSEATAVDSPIDEAIRLKSGVCQDFAHIAIALLRRLGIPARYVSGYLFHEGSDRDVASNASHAWVEAYLPSLGWIGIDPTNDRIAADHHIRIGVGRDYADVPPTKGVYKGEADSELAVAVSVSKTRREPVQDAALHIVRRSNLAGTGRVPGLELGQQQQQQQRLDRQQQQEEQQQQ
jgi:transglutaminase-like putative cysteine protease